MRLKKAFAVILAIAMVFGAVSLASAATPVAGGFADAAENKQADQIAYLRALGIAKGDENGNYNPDAALTRQEFVTFVARLAGETDSAEFLSGTASRYLDDADIADWARGPVNLADTLGWVQGYDDGKFHPTDTLTFAQAVTVLIRVLGHEAVVTGVWPNSHVIKGISLGLNNGVSLSANTPISRADMGRLLFNALFIAQLEPVGDGKWQSGASLMAGRTAQGTVLAVNNTSITISQGDDPALTRNFDDSVTLIGNAASFAALQGLNVRITSADITKSSAKVTVVEVLGASTTGNLVVKEVKTVNDASTGFVAKTFIFFEDDSKIEYNGDTTYSLNGSAPVKSGGKYVTGDDPANVDTTAPTILSLVKKGDWVIVSESGGVAKHVQVTSWQAAHADNNQVLGEDGAVQTEADNKDQIEYEDNTVVATGGSAIALDGTPAKVTDLKKGDVVSVALKMEWVLDDSSAAPADHAWSFELVEDEDNDNVAYYIAAYRNVIQGEVVKIVAGATTKRTLKLADGTTKELTDAAGATGTANAAVGATVKALLNGKGDVAHYATVTGPEAAVKYVRGTGLTVIQESGKADSYALAANRAGEAENVPLKTSVKIGATTYDLSKTTAGDGRAEFITALGSSDYWEVADNGGELVKINTTAVTGTIVAIDSVNKTVTLRDNAAGNALTVTVKGFAAYKTGATGAYVKFEDLKVSSTVNVTYYNVTGGTALIILP